MLLAVGAVAAFMVWRLLPETLRRRAPETVSIASILRSYRRFLGERAFVIHLGVATCCMAGLFSWISTCAFVLQDIYHLSALSFGLAFAAASGGYLTGNAIAVSTITLPASLRILIRVPVAGGWRREGHSSSRDHQSSRRPVHGTMIPHSAEPSRWSGWRNSSRMEAIPHLSSTRPMGNIKGKQAAIDEPIALEIFTGYV